MVLRRIREYFFPITATSTLLLLIPWLVGSDGQVEPGLGVSAAFEEAQNIFSGSNANPTFTTGAASNGFFFEPGKEDEPPATLDIQTVAQTPEPSSLVLLGSGLLGFAGVMRRKLAISF